MMFLCSLGGFGSFQHHTPSLKWPGRNWSRVSLHENIYSYNYNQIFTDKSIFCIQINRSQLVHIYLSIYPCRLINIIYIYIYIYIWYVRPGPLALRLECSSMVWGSFPRRVISKTQKLVLDASLLNTQHYKVWIKGKTEQSKEKCSALPSV